MSEEALEAARVLRRLAAAIELAADNPRPARAFASAARTIRQMQGDLRSLYECGALTEIRGIGPAVLDVVGAVLRGEVPLRLAKLEADIPPDLFRILQLKGLGPKKVRLLWKELGITTLGELEYACLENRLTRLHGFGQKIQEQVLKGIADLRAREGLLRRDQAMYLFAELRDALERAGATETVIAGDYHRGKELCEGLEVVTVATEEQVQAALVAFGAPKATFDGVELYIRCAEASQLGAVRVYRSSSRAHRASLAERAESRGSRFGPEGLHPVDPERPAGEAIEDEAALYRALGLALTPAERREAKVPLVELGHPTPELVSLASLKGSLHNHTVDSDGAHTLVQMREGAARMGLSYLGISEHSRTASYARGLEIERLKAQILEIARLNLEGHACELLSGVESDILADGSLDYPQELLAQLEFVIASVHYRYRQGPEEMTERLVRAAKSPYTTVIGHPTGRLLLGRAPIDFEMEQLLSQCEQSGCALELNANPQRLDLSIEHLGMARERGIPISISADAHSVPGLSNLQHGVAIARRAGVRVEEVLNCRSLEELRTWLGERRPS